MHTHIFFKCIYVNIYIYLFSQIIYIYQFMGAQKIDGFTAVSIASEKKTHSILITILSVSKYMSR